MALFLAFVIGLGVWLTRQDTTHQAPFGRGGAATVARVDSSAAKRLLNRFQSAIRHRDLSAGARLGATPVARSDLRGVVRNARLLHVTAFSLRSIEAVGAPTPDNTWGADVTSTWRFAGFDHRTVHMPVRFRFSRSGGAWRIAGIGGGDRRSPLWLSGPVQVRRTSESLVLVAGSPARADAFAALARRAVHQVRRVLPRWTGGLVLEVAATEAGLDEALHAPRGEYAGIAAVTTTVDGSRSRRSPSHVFVNPRVFDLLRPRGAQVVITHETTHVATDAANSPAPIWLVEGFADYVALRAQEIPLATTAARIITLVRRNGVPRTLPTTAQFAAGAAHLEARYESAWLACRLLAREGGQQALVAFYRAMDAGGALGPELRSHFGFGPATFTRQWRTLLSDFRRE